MHEKFYFFILNITYQDILYVGNYGETISKPKTHLKKSIFKLEKNQKGKTQFKRKYPIIIKNKILKLEKNQKGKTK